MDSCGLHRSGKSPLTLCLPGRTVQPPVQHISRPLLWIYSTNQSPSPSAGRRTSVEAAAGSTFSNSAGDLDPCVKASFHRIRSPHHQAGGLPSDPSPIPWRPFATADCRSDAVPSACGDTGTWADGWKLSETLYWSRDKSLGWCSCWSSPARRSP